jgi:hypothetical protein
MSDTLDFGGSVAENTLVIPKVRAEAVTQVERDINIYPKPKDPFLVPIQGTSDYQKWLSAEDKKSIQNLLDVDIELATALRLSLVESQAKAAREKRESEALMSQIKSWDDEIRRLKDWSEVFDISLGAKPSEAETRKQYSIIERLAKIGGAFSTLTTFLVSVLFQSVLYMK